MSLRIRSAVLATLILCGSSRAARAADVGGGGSEDRATAINDERASDLARTTFDQAREAFARKSYAAAAAAFEQSASYVSHPAPWVNAAEAWMLSGDPVRAARACDRALALSNHDARIHAQAEERLAKVMPLVATLEIVGTSGVAVRVDGAEPRSLPTTLRLAPGVHRIEAVGASATTPWSIDLRAGTTTRRELARRDDRLSFYDPRFALREDPSSPEAVKPTPRRSSAPPLATWISYGVGTAAAGTSAAFGLATLDAREGWRDTASEDARSNFYLDRTLTNVTLGVAVVAFVTGTVLWIRHGLSTREPAVSAE